MPHRRYNGRPPPLADAEKCSIPKRPYHTGQLTQYDEVEGKEYKDYLTAQRLAREKRGEKPVGVTPGQRINKLQQRAQRVQTWLQVCDVIHQ